MSTLSTDAASRREAARSSDGTFGHQHHSESSVTLAEPFNGESVPGTTARTTRQAAEDFIALQAESGADHTWNAGEDLGDHWDVEGRVAARVAGQVQDVVNSVHEAELDDALLELSDALHESGSGFTSVEDSATVGQAAGLRALVKTGSTTGYTSQVAFRRQDVIHAHGADRRDCALAAMDAELATGRTRHPDQHERGAINRATEDPGVFDEAIIEAVDDSVDQRDTFGSVLMRNLYNRGEAMI